MSSRFGVFSSSVGTKILIGVTGVALFLYLVIHIAGRLVVSLVGALCIGVSLAVQGRGHRLEAEAPAPFAGPGDFIARLVAEQWITFPRFVLSGGWYRNLQAAQRVRS